MKTYIIDLKKFIADQKGYGVKLVAFTDDPAIEMMAIALNAHQRKLMFSNKTKKQIAGPLIIPKTIYRNDNGDEYQVKFTKESIKELAINLMANISELGANFFTDEHSDVKLDAYILELVLVDSAEKQLMLKNQYGYNMPMDGIWINVQCRNEKTYDYLIKSGKTGFSIDGMFPMVEESLQLSKIINQNKMKGKKIKLTKKYRFRDGFFKFKSTRKRKAVALEADALDVGDEITIYDEDGAVIEDWTGEIEVLIDSEVTTIEVVKDEIKTVEVEPEEEEVVDEELELADEIVEEIPVVETPSAVDLTPVIELLTEIKEMIASLISAETETKEDTKLSAKKPAIEKLFKNK